MEGPIISPELVEPEKKKRKKRIAIVDTSEALESQARDMAEERLTADKAERDGIWISRTFKNIWKHNLFREYYRQKEIATAKEEIKSKENIYGHDAEQSAHEEAMNAVVERFVSEYEDGDILHRTGDDKTTEKRIVLGSSGGPEEVKISIGIKGLIREYAGGRISEEVFRIERDRLVAEATGLKPEDIKGHVAHTDNILEIAEQVKKSVDHNAALDEIDIVLGRAKLGVRTEAKYNAVDKITDKLQSTWVGRYLNETTIASGVAIAYSVAVGWSQRLARSKALAWGTFGASAVVGGAIAGARESVKITDERRQHARERAKGKEITKDMDRRVEMEQVIHSTVPAPTLIDSIRRSAENINSPELFFATLDSVAEAEARIHLSDTEKIDLISYSNFSNIEQERLELDLARAEAKSKLRKMAKEGVIDIPEGKNFDEFYSSCLDIQKAKLREGETGIEAKDRLFSKMKTRKVVGAVAKGIISGLVIGGIAQETSAFFNDSKQGLLERLFSGAKHNNIRPQSTTALEGLRRLWMQDHVPVRIPNNITLPGGVNVVLPDGVDIVPDPNNAGEFIFTKDGEVVADHIQFNNGALTQASHDLLVKNGVNITNHVNTTVNQVPSTVMVNRGPQDIVDQNPSLFQRIHRKFWYDNNTTRFDKNELKLDWGGRHGTGIDSNGDYVFTMKRMTAGGSMFKNMSVDARQAMADGKLKMLLSLSRDTQFNCVEVPIDANGNAIIDPASDIAKMFFRNDGGQLTFIGKFAEVGYSDSVAPDGIAQFKILATEVGEGMKSMEVPETIFTPETIEDTVTTFEVTDPEPYIEPPIFLPIFGRRPMEKLNNLPSKVIYGYNGFSNVIRKDYEGRMSEDLKNNPDAKLDERKETVDYLSRQTPEHSKDIEDLANQAGLMDPKCKLSVCIPVAGHQEGKNIYQTLKNYLDQTANPEEFEIVLLVNHPDKDKGGKKITPDETLSEIKRFMQDHPELKVRVMNKVIPINSAKIGYVRKLLNDAVLMRESQRVGIVGSHIIVSNDADNKGVATEYIQNFINKFEQNKNTDAFMGQLDWDPESYADNPLIHVGTRLFQYVDLQQRRKSKNSIASSGANFAFRSGIYAAVNGYSTDFELAEDVDLGRAIKAARFGAKYKRAIAFAGARVSRLFTSSRRAEKAIKDGLSPIEQWEKGFSAFDDEVRKVDWKALAKDIDYDNPEQVAKVVNGIEHIINRTMKAMTWVHGNQVLFRRALGWLGIKYKLVGVNQIKIVDSKMLVKGLKQYKGDLAELLKRKTKKKV